MGDTASQVRRIQAAMQRAGDSREALDELSQLFEALLELGCAAADEDLAECSGEGLRLLGQARTDDGAEREHALAELRVLIAALATAYDLDALEDEPQPAQAEQTSSSPELSAPSAPSFPTNLQVQEAAEDEERDAEILAEFIIEANEHLSEAEGHLLSLESEPRSKEAIGALFRGFHSIKGLAGFLAFPEVERLAHAAEDLLALAREYDGALPPGAPDLIFEAVDGLQRAIGAIKQAADQGQPQPPPGIGSPALIERIKVLWREAKVNYESVPVPPRPIRPVVAELVDIADDMPDEGDELSAAPVGRPTGGRGKRETIRVDAERLDRLVDMVGELVITESMVTRSIQELGTSARLTRHLTRMDKITRELHELAGSLRMVPVRSTFRKMARLARDVARKSNKRITFEVHGEDAELDKTLVDRIGDPLVHMVRNAIDHGLETDPEMRRAAGKPDSGRVVLRALHRGGTIHIEVEDDGRGLDPDKILARAKERGLVRGDETLGKRDIVRLICEPGFSTAEKVTSISGRGVGMDVVRQQIEAMNGTLEVTSEVGKGTCFSMQLPLTLAVIDGMVMRLGFDRFVVPTLSVVRLVQPGQANVVTVLGRGEVLRLGNNLIPVVRPEHLFGIPLAGDRPPMAIVIEVDHGRVAMLVDELLGQQQVVIKSLGDGLGDVPGLAGAAIMPDGRVGLVLDVSSIVRKRTGPTREGLRDAG